MMDDRSRMQLFRTIYGFPTLSKYAMDPAKPIRISVQNGNVTLYGVVDVKWTRMSRVYAPIPYLEFSR
jgi:hyperosmotically inducible periplasmic protein